MLTTLYIITTTAPSVNCSFPLIRTLALRLVAATISRRASCTVQRSVGWIFLCKRGSSQQHLKGLKQFVKVVATQLADAKLKWNMFFRIFQVPERRQVARKRPPVGSWWPSRVLWPRCGIGSISAHSISLGRSEVLRMKPWGHTSRSTACSFWGHHLDTWDWRGCDGVNWEPRDQMIQVGSQFWHIPTSLVWSFSGRMRGLKGLFHLFRSGVHKGSHQQRWHDLDAFSLWKHLTLIHVIPFKKQPYEVHKLQAILWVYYFKYKAIERDR